MLDVDVWPAGRCCTSVPVVACSMQVRVHLPSNLDVLAVDDAAMSRDYCSYVADPVAQDMIVVALAEHR